MKCPFYNDQCPRYMERRDNGKCVHLWSCKLKRVGIDAFDLLNRIYEIKNKSNKSEVDKTLLNRSSTNTKGKQ